ncbi:hypothetical protein BC477_19815 [Clavibacter michiganensis subsp. michiganensis]|uniref:Uncharacterized protein n=1 Tax=Clavibacter michiganensis subsp. michiganensis TaxID=33013 RepID=A0A251XCN6_CLAMM|nr:hypothetical protein BC477_19815 [Clavibacter michiganensis subsp. michiganensis]OUD99937.1 hypothetical protein CMMCAS07_19355 [Clavibacter michiganensis subsp. michiganensis]
MDPHEKTPNDTTPHDTTPLDPATARLEELARASPSSRRCS